MPIKLTTEEFIIKSINKHDNKFSYDKSEYVNAKTEICLICPVHGEFWQRAYNHLRGDGCPQCAGVKKISNDEFIKKIIHKFGNKYDLSKTLYFTAKEKVCLICPIHGEFWQMSNDLLRGNGCPTCQGFNKNDKNVKTELNLIHNNRYDYSKLVYRGSKEHIIIICHQKDKNGNEHGEFTQTYFNHKDGHGCPKCGGSEVSNNEIFIPKSKLFHGDKYDYSKVFYEHAHKKVIIICPIHGEFKQTPNKHLHSNGCPYCNESRLEREVNQFLEENHINFERQKRFDWLGKQSLDFYLHEYNIAIECQGRQHFEPVKQFGGAEALIKTKKLDTSKFELCYKNNIKLLYYTDKQYYKYNNGYLGELIIDINSIINIYQSNSH